MLIAVEAGLVCICLRDDFIGFDAVRCCRSCTEQTVILGLFYVKWPLWCVSRDLLNLDHTRTLVDLWHLPSDNCRRISKTICSIEQFECHTVIVEKFMGVLLEVLLMVFFLCE